MILPDVLQRDLEVVFCGIAAGDESAKRGAYYAGPGNQFWAALYRMGFTPRRFRPEEFRELADCDIGLTDLVKNRSGRDREMREEDFDTAGLRAKIEEFAPRVLAFNGKRAAEAFLGRKVDYGFQEERIGRTFVFVLPSTSGAARGHWDASWWVDLADFLSEGGPEEQES